MSNVRYALYHPLSKIYIHQTSATWRVRFTDDPAKIKTYTSKLAAYNAYKQYVADFPSMLIVAIELVVKIIPVDASSLVNMKKSLNKELAEYATLKELYDADAEAMSERKWARFKKLRTILRDYL